MIELLFWYIVLSVGIFACVIVYSIISAIAEEVSNYIHYRKPKPKPATKEYKEPKLPNFNQ